MVIAQDLPAAFFFCYTAYRRVTVALQSREASAPLRDRPPLRKAIALRCQCIERCRAPRLPVGQEALAALELPGRSDPKCVDLVNNAGIYMPKAFTDYTEEDYNLVMNTNVASFFYMTQQVIPQMKKQNSGHVVSISGASVDQPSGAATELLAVLSKSPMPAASKALALEYAANNIRFNTVSPAVVNTPMHAKANHAELAKLHPLGRMGEVSDVVDAVLYLQSATFVTGENIRVDGGVHAGR